MHVWLHVHACMSVHACVAAGICSDDTWGDRTVPRGGSRRCRCPVLSSLSTNEGQSHASLVCRSVVYQEMLGSSVGSLVCVHKTTKRDKPKHCSLSTCRVSIYTHSIVQPHTLLTHLTRTPHTPHSSHLSHVPLTLHTPHTSHIPPPPHWHPHTPHTPHTPHSSHPHRWWCVGTRIHRRWGPRFIE